MRCGRVGVSASACRSSTIRAAGATELSFDRLFRLARRFWHELVRADPVEDLIGVMLIQRRSIDPFPMAVAFERRVYDAIDD